MTDMARSPYGVSRKPANFTSLARAEERREKEKYNRKTTIMEVNYGGMIAKIIGNKKRVSEILYSLSLSLFPSILSFFIFYVFFGCQATVTPKGIEASFNYKNSAVPCSLIPLPTLYVLSASNRRISLSKILFIAKFIVKSVVVNRPFFYASENRHEE